MRGNLYFFFTFLVTNAIGTFAAAETKIVFLGDSLTEGYGISVDAAFPALVEKKLRAEGKPVSVVNAGTSGATTASGPARINWILQSQPDVLVVALGANDGLRGLAVTASKENIRTVIRAARQKKVKVLLVGMKLPNNYGDAYRVKFENMFSELAREEKVAFLPFLLEGVGAVRELNLPDGIHPNEKGHVMMAETVLKYLRKLL